MSKAQELIESFRNPTDKDEEKYRKEFMNFLKDLQKSIPHMLKELAKDDFSPSSITAGKAHEMAAVYDADWYRYYFK